MAFRPRLARENMRPLIALLEDESPDVREKTAFAIGQTGEAGLEALPALERLLTDKEETVRSRAARSIEIIRDSQKLVEAKRAVER